MTAPWGWVGAAPGPGAVSGVSVPGMRRAEGRAGAGPGGAQLAVGPAGAGAGTGLVWEMGQRAGLGLRLQHLLLLLVHKGSRFVSVPPFIPLPALWPAECTARVLFVRFRIEGFPR